MKILMVNSFCGIGSTGRICTDLADVLIEKGHDVKIAYGRESVPDKYKNIAVRIGTDLDVKLHGMQTRLFDTHGFGSKSATKRFIEWAESYDPDVLHLHNIHGYYINIEMLFEWIKKRPKMRVIWTLHDCWAFTGHCVHFTMVKCTQWKTHCGYCPQKRTYPRCDLFSNCRNNSDRKKAAFTGVKNMTLVTPSKWLAGLVKESFLKEYLVKVINNGIDTSVFKPTPSDFRKRYHLENKKIILGVASVWDERKGLNDFINLSKMLDEDYKIVLVGLSEKQMREVPDSILKIQRTNSTKELAEIYTVADVFFNPTYEDNYPTVNLEAQACGTPVITYDSGGSGESTLGENVIEKSNYTSLRQILNKTLRINSVSSIKDMNCLYLDEYNRISL